MHDRSGLPRRPPGCALRAATGTGFVARPRRARLGSLASAAVPCLLLVAACAAATEPPAPLPSTEPPARPEAAPDPAPLPPTGAFARTLAPGLTLAAHLPPDIEDIGFHRVDPAGLAQSDRRLYVVTIDPRRYAFSYLSVRDPAVGGRQLTVGEWADTHALEVAFNPGMFEPDGRATGYTRAGGFVSQASVRRHRLYRAWFLIEAEGATTLDQVPPQAPGIAVPYASLPEAFRTRLDRAALVSQSLVVMRGGAAAYPPRTRQWSELAYGTDVHGQVVVVFSRHPWEMRELGHRLAALDLGIDTLLHGEGGPEASLLVRAGGIELLKVGSYETGFADDSNQQAWILPAVLGARRK